ncbi:MAG: RCC1 domain-containing protein, partial [Actinomycetota bacterium]
METFRQERVRHLRRTSSIWAIFITTCLLLAIPAPEHVRATVSVSSTDPTGRIAAGDKHTCAIARNDSIWCWGDNTYSQLG